MHDDLEELKFRLSGHLQPGESLHRNWLLDDLYSFVPKDPQARVQIYNYEIAPGGYTAFHLHTGPTFFLTLQGRFEAHFEEGILVTGEIGRIYSEPIGVIHRGHNPHPTLALLGIGFSITSPHIQPIVNVEPPAWAPVRDA